MKHTVAQALVVAALILAILLMIMVITGRYAEAGWTCTTYGGKGPGGHRWSQTTCR